MNGEEGTGIEFDAGYSYIIADDVEYAYNSLKGAIPGRNLICITREYPERVKFKYGLDGTFIWLTFTKEPDTMRPTDPQFLFNTLRDFMQTQAPSVIFLDGLEYMIVHNDYKEILKFLQSLKDHVMLQNSILIIPYSREALSTQERALLERELIPIFKD